MSDNPSRPQWRWPNFPEIMGGALFALTAWILYRLAPAPGKDPSELFKLLAQAVVLTGFIGGPIAALYTATRDGQKKNDVIATQAKLLADQPPAPSAPPADPAA